jgi:hypothetical protein
VDIRINQILSVLIYSQRYQMFLEIHFAANSSRFFEDVDNSAFPDHGDHARSTDLPIRACVAHEQPVGCLTV